MADQQVYEPTYSSSHALIIGIDKYEHASPLAHARSDAEAVAEFMHTRFGFPPENVELLVDGAARGAAIRRKFFSYADPDLVQPNDRILVFFAGHGFTVSGRRGETGFLVPVDGRMNDLSSLISWDELTRNADLIAAKHIFFLMDACYGGLALTRRTVPTGRMRFLKDMIQRYARQVLTAGKADELVADAGGTRPGHSIFTAHVLDALEDGIGDTALTANSLMAYVYEKVGSDPRSQQTPHYGFVGGDGDFVFDTSLLDELPVNAEKGEDLLIQISPPMAELPVPQTTADTIKALIPDPRDAIRLDDTVSSYIRKTLGALDSSNFPVNAQISAEEFAQRLKAFEAAIDDLSTIVILLSKWATASQLPLLQKIVARLAEVERPGSGLTIWINSHWYPVQFLMYCGGIAAISAQRFDALAALFLTRVNSEGRRASGRPNVTLIERVTDPMTELHNAFKLLPGHENQHVPRSEYLFTEVQPRVEDILFLGRSYEADFDEFEVLWALVYASFREGNIWGPPGRFAWKHHRGRESPLNVLIADAERQGANWGPLRAGLFGGDHASFLKVANEYKALIEKHPMW